VVADGDQQRRALITGFTGQDGSYLAELLLDKGYEVVGMVRGPVNGPLEASEHLRDRVELITGELLDPATLAAPVADLRPAELYHLAAPSFVLDSWVRPAETVAAITTATAALLEAVRDRSPGTRTFVATSSAIFGDAPESPQHEDTPCRPQNPYATAKLAAHQLVGQMRGDGLFACSGILYNHESERRPESFVTRKITHAAAAIKLGLEHELVLGDLDAVRDWSFAGDTVRGAWLMLQQEEPDDYILASGVGHTVRDFAEVAFAYLGLNAQDHIQIDQSLVRRAELAPPIGDPTQARERLGWDTTLSFEQLVESMVDADLRTLEAAA
jgi:GDPmannose 4,6-dehydratase